MALRTIIAILALLVTVGCEEPCPSGSSRTEDGRCVERRPDSGEADDAAVLRDAALDAHAGADASIDASGTPDACERRAYYLDSDGDGHGAGAAVEACAPLAGHSESTDDCDDSDPQMHPGATEACDGEDQDCDAAIDEGLATAPYYRDADGDGFGDRKESVLACRMPSGHVLLGTDCDDACADCRPGGSELCDLRDNDCDETTDEGVTTRFYPDCDCDGYTRVTGMPLDACAAPPTRPAECTGPTCAGSGWTTRSPAMGTDCFDTEARAFPGQTMFFTTPIAGASGMRRFDYDCDGGSGTSDMLYPDVNGDCTPSCSAVPGWIASVPAMCGVTADYLDMCNRVGGSFCVAPMVRYTQACR